MQRLTMTIDEDLAEKFDRFMARKGYQNRSEAIRDLLREKLEQERVEDNRASHCIASLTYVYNHEERELSSRLTKAQHDHHDLSLATLHVHLDHDNCMESVVLRGAIGDVKAFANQVTSQKGVRHGNLHLVPANVEVGDHVHGKNNKNKEQVPHIHSHPST